MQSLSETDQKSKTGDIGIAEILTWLNRYKYILMAFTILSALTAGIVSYFIPPTYESKALLLPVARDDGSDISRSALSGLAGAVLGNNTSTVNDAAVTLAYMRSASIILNFIKKENLLPELFPDEWNKKTKKWIDKAPLPSLIAKKFSRQVTATQNKENFLELTVNWNDPKKAQFVVQEFISYINSLRRDQDRRVSEQNLSYLYARLREEPTQELRNTISAMIAKEMQTIMRTKSPTDYALKIIDPPLVPDFRASPKRLLIIIFGAMFGLAAGILMLLSRQAIRAEK